MTLDTQSPCAGTAQRDGRGREGEGFRTGDSRIPWLINVSVWQKNHHNIRTKFLKEKKK